MPAEDVVGVVLGVWLFVKLGIVRQRASPSPDAVPATTAAQPSRTRISRPYAVVSLALAAGLAEALGATGLETGAEEDSTGGGAGVVGRTGVVSSAGRAVMIVVEAVEAADRGTCDSVKGVDDAAADVRKERPNAAIVKPRMRTPAIAIHRPHFGFFPTSGSDQLPSVFSSGTFSYRPAWLMCVAAKASLAIIAGAGPETVAVGAVEICSICSSARAEMRLPNGASAWANSNAV